MDRKLWKHHAIHFNQAKDALDIDPYAKAFLHKLTRNKNDPQEIDTAITPQKLKDNYKNWAEQISTPPEGRYLSLYKTWLDFPEEKIDMYSGITSDNFFGATNTVINICKKHNITLPRWITIHNISKQKES
eukprot:3838678-Ditylum_brightwellii.AAC.1